MPIWVPLLVIATFVIAILIAIAHVANPKMPTPSKWPGACPVCMGKTILQTGKVYECANCHSILRIAITRRSLWAIPTILGMCAVILLTIPLERSGFLSGVWLAASRGALTALAFGLSARVLIQGLKYRVASSGPHR
jgi:hypothetical protein